MISLPHLQHVSSIIQVIPQALLPFQFLCSTSSVINLNLINFVRNMNIIYKIYIRQTWQFIHKIYLFFYLLHFLKEAFALLLFFEAEKQSSSELFKSSLQIIHAFTKTYPSSYSSAPADYTITNCI